MGRLASLVGIALLSGGLSACVSEPDLSAIPDDTQALPAFDRATQAIDTAGLGQAAKPPSGFVAFCERNPEECRAPRGAADTVALNDALWARLEEVNLTVNRAILPLDDSVHYGVAEFWTVPIDGHGDCEDYVLAKRKMLMLLGLPEPALRITVAYTRAAVRHAVLTVVTDRGDYVLDNMRDEILSPDRVDYSWVERQDAASRTGWTELNGSYPSIASSGNTGRLSLR